MTVDPYVPGHGNPGFTVARYELDLDYRVASNRLVAQARLYVTATEPLTRFSLDLAGLRVNKVLVNGRRPSRYVHRTGKLQISLDAPVGVGTSLVVDVAYSGQPLPIVGFWGEVGWEELADGVIVAAQPDGAPSWFPCDDHPRDKASFQITVTTDAGYAVVANGVQASRTALASRVRWVFDQPEPTATYLATVQIGRYEPVRMSDRPVRQRGLVPGPLRQTFLHDFGRQHDMMALFVELFGPYPFAEYTVVVTEDDLEIPLEAQGMSVFGANHLDGRRGHERLAVHELAHQWFGNSVTVRRWQDIWLHEGFACYAEWLWSERSGGPTAATMARKAWSDLRELPQDILVGDPGPARMFDDRIYQRGALTLHAIRAVVGDTAFFDTLRSWTRTHAHGNGSTQDFLDCASRFTDEPLHHLFEAWLFQSELPPLVSERTSISAT